MQSRRKFIQQTALASGTLLTSNRLFAEMQKENALKQLTILHTNDVHSRLEPFAMDGSKNQGLGGVAARAAMIKQIRNEGGQVLLLDAGDIFQGTPFFNLYKGEPEMKAMAAMGYDAATMGNHDFDAGLDNFVKQLGHATFPILLCNYDFTNTPMEFKYQPYKIFKKGKLKIGVTGVGIEMAGLVPDNLFGNTKYFNPIEKVNETAAKLKKEASCDMVICLSHLGYKYNNNKISDIVLAKETENIDLIIGAHTHTFMESPEAYKNKSGDDVIINQVGWAGIQMGRLDFDFAGIKKKNLLKSHNVVIDKKTME
jgi:5'-nucleotidase